MVADWPGATASLEKRVTWTLADSCGTCRTCTRDQLPQKCTQLFKYRHAGLSDGTELNGTYAAALLTEAGVATIAAVRAHTPDGVDAVIQAAGVRQLLNEGPETLRRSGWYEWVGLVHPDSVISFTAEQIISRSLTVCGIHNYAPSDHLGTQANRPDSLL